MSAPHQSQTFWARSWRKLKRNPSGMTGLVVVGMLLFVALFAPLLANDRPIVASYQDDVKFPAVTTYVDSWVPWVSMRNNLKSWEMSEGYFPFSDHYPELDGKNWKEVEEDLDWGVWPIVKWSPRQFDSEVVRLKPGDHPQHWLGTDDAGRDVLSRLIHGTVVAMLVGIVAMGIACSIGITLGLTAGFFGGWVDLVLSRVTEVVMCFPTFFLIIAVIAFLEPSIVNIMMVIGLVGWTGIFRLIRGEVLQTRSQDFVASATALGFPSWRTMFVHVLPNSISPVFVAVAFGIARAVLTETSLSFLGFGDPEVPSWGEIVKQGRFYVSQGMWHLTIFPGLAIFVTLTAFNLFGQGLRDVLDPKLKD